jgi:hypothetical protein
VRGAWWAHLVSGVGVSAWGVTGVPGVRGWVTTSLFGGDSGPEQFTIRMGGHSGLAG